MINELSTQQQRGEFPDARAFRPRPAVAGWITSLALLACLGALAVPALRFAASPKLEKRVAPIVVGVLAIPVVFFTLILPTMRYKVDSHNVELRCGPFHWSVAVGSIRRVYETDLEYLPLSEGWKLPGYTLFRIRYGGVGKVRMCATAMCTRILILETEKEMWGLTPADVQGFVAAIRPQGRD